MEFHIRLGGTNEIKCLLPFFIELTNEFAIEDFFCIRKISQQNLTYFFIMRINPTTSDPEVSIREKKTWDVSPK